MDLDIYVGTMSRGFGTVECDTIRPYVCVVAGSFARLLAGVTLAVGLLAGAALTMGATGGEKPVHSMAPTFNIFNICFRIM